MLEDLDKMPFGCHKGKPLQDVPASYFHWLWHKPGFDKRSPIGEYIRENISAFKQEDPDLIWD